MLDFYNNLQGVLGEISYTPYTSAIYMYISLIGDPCRSKTNCFEILFGGFVVSIYRYCIFRKQFELPSFQIVVKHSKRMSNLNLNRYVFGMSSVFKGVLEKSLYLITHSKQMQAVEQMESLNVIKNRLFSKTCQVYIEFKPKPYCSNLIAHNFTGFKMY